MMRKQSKTRQGRITVGLMAILFIGMLAFALAPEEVCAASESAGSWQELQNKFNSLNNVTIELSDECVASESDSCLILQEGKKITLDLNGHTLDRNADFSITEETDAVIVYGDLTIIDKKNTGKITGGRGLDGAFKVDGGALTIKGGTITGNSAWSTAGGVCVDGGGSFTMNGGSIENNYGESVGGVVLNNGSFNLTDGKITDNDSYFYNGGVYIYKGTFTMSGGEISGNDGQYCAGVMIPEDGAGDAVFDLRGGSVAGGKVNYSFWEEDTTTGSIDVRNGTFKLSGNPSISSGEFADVYLAEGKRIDVTGKLKDDLSLSVETEKEPAEGAPITITNGLQGNGDIFNFSSYKGYGVGENTAGEAVLGTPALDITYKAGDGTGSDVSMKGIKDYTYTLLDCMFTPPDEMEFTGWIFWSNPTIHEAGTTFTLNSSKRLTAQYECIEHDWTEIEYEWDEDNTEVTAERICQRCGEEDEETVSAEEEIVEPTCEEPGLVTWTSEEFENEDFEVQIKTEDIDPIGHDWGVWKVIKKANALTAGSKQRVCDNDPTHVEEETIPAAGVSGTLLAKMTAKGGKGLKIGWTKVNGAEGYDIFFARCNSGGKEIACKKVKTISGNKTFSWKKTGLKKKTAYKMYVKAFAAKDGKKTYIRTSPTMHAFTSGYDKNYTNAKAVTLKEKTVTLKKGKTYKIEASVKKLKSKKKLMTKGHAPKLRYLSSDKKIVTVSNSGKIAAKAKGVCTVYVYAHNGLSKSIKVTVK